MFDKDGPTFFELLDQALKSTKDGYELLAPKFDKTPFRTPDDVVKRAVETIGDPIDSALDLCTGTGVGLVALRPMTKKRLVGIDFSPAMLTQAKAALGIEPRGLVPPPEGGPKIELLEKDVFAMDFDKQFDVATCFGALGHIPEADEAKFLGLVRKALVPGGRFVFVTADRPKAYDPRALVARGFNLAMRVRNALISPPFVMYYLTFVLPDIERKLRWTGFDVTLHRDVFEGPFKPLVVVVARRI